MLKKVVSIFCIAFILFSLVSCSSANPTETGTSSGGLSESYTNSGSAAANTVLDTLTTDVTFGHVTLGLQVQMPALDLDTLTPFHVMTAYPHGFELSAAKSPNMYWFCMETSLTGETDLEKLPLIISKEKESVPADVFSDEPYSGLVNITKLDHTAKEQVGSYQAVYFEIDSVEGEGQLPITAMGYAVNFEGTPVCLTVKYAISEAYGSFTKEEAKECLQYMLLTLAPYNGEAYYELQPDNHINKYYNNPNTSYGFDHEDLRSQMPVSFKLWGLQKGTLSMAAQSGAGTDFDDLVYPYKAINYAGEPYIRCEELLTGDLNYDSILPVVLESTELLKEFGYAFSESLQQRFTILNEQDVTVHGIQMKRYEVQVSSRQYELSDFMVVYTFIYDGLPYAWKMGSDGLYKLTEGDADYYMSMLRIWADTMIRTIQLDGF